jgi:hypothetical protein
MVEHWKGIVGYVHEKTGRLYSEEAMRKIVSRDGKLSKALDWFHGRPGINQQALDEWIQRGKGKKRLAA